MIDYKEAYEEITAPFKADGTEYIITQPKKVIQLMQMGVNYNYKMLTLKPHLAKARLMADIDIELLRTLVLASQGDLKALADVLILVDVDPLDLDLTTLNTVTSGKSM